MASEATIHEGKSMGRKRGARGFSPRLQLDRGRSGVGRRRDGAEGGSGGWHCCGCGAREWKPERGRAARGDVGVRALLKRGPSHGGGGRETLPRANVGAGWLLRAKREKGDGADRRARLVSGGERS